MTWTYDDPRLLEPFGATSFRLARDGHGDWRVVGHVGDGISPTWDPGDDADLDSLTDLVDASYRDDLAKFVLQDPVRRTRSDAQLLDPRGPCHLFLVEVSPDQRELLVCRPVSNTTSAASLRNRLQQLEERAADLARLELLAQFAGGAVHDINNMLSVMIGLAQLIEENTEEAQTRDDAREIRLSGKAAAKIARRVLHVGDDSSPYAASDIATQFDELSPILELFLSEGISLETKVEDDLPGVAVGHVEMEQILLNLVINARDAIDDEGTIVVEAGASEEPGFVRLTVTDDGHGIEPDRIDNIFDPFYSTKGDGGTGLGLATVARIVDEAEGRYRVDSRLGDGTCFTLELPTLRDESTEVGLGNESTEELSMDVDRTILVGDPAEEIVEYAETILVDSGCTVLKSHTHQHTVERIEKRETLDTVVVDRTLVDEDEKLLEAALSEHEDVTTVVVTSANPSVDVPDFASRILLKPFTPFELLLAVGAQVG